MPARRPAVLKLLAVVVLLLTVSPFTAPFATYDLGVIANAGKTVDGSDTVKSKLASFAFTTDVSWLPGRLAPVASDATRRAGPQTVPHDSRVPTSVLRI